MIIIDKQHELADFLESIEFEGFGVVKLDKVSFELSSSVIDEVTIIHSEVLRELDAASVARLSELTLLIVFQKDSNEQINLIDNIVDIINPKTSKKLFENKIALLSELIKERQVLKSQLITINNELTETMGNVEVELLKIKKIYEKKAPKRFNDLKGIQVFSKYSAGENIGGEFFDIFVEGNQAFVVMSSTSSYLASSMILKLFADFKADGVIGKQEVLNFIDDTKSNIIELNTTKKKEIEIHLFTGIVDFNKHSIEGNIFGDFKILSSQVKQNRRESVPLITGDLVKSSFAKDFQREERILLCSPGFLKNWKKLNPEFMMEELMMDKKIKPIDVLDEAFFQLKKDATGPFLSYDASAIFMEVNKNAMVEV
jgi:hypothetical protein